MPREELSEPIKLDPIAILSEVVPWLLQAAAITALCLAARGDFFYTFLAVAAGHCWLLLGKNRLPDTYGYLRATEHLFTTVGAWLGREDAKDEFDEIRSRYLFIDNHLTHRDNRAVVTAAGIANLLRGFTSGMLFLYLSLVLYEFAEAHSDAWVPLLTRDLLVDAAFVVGGLLLLLLGGWVAGYLKSKRNWPANAALAVGVVIFAVGIVCGAAALTMNPRLLTALGIGIILVFVGAQLVDVWSWELPTRWEFAGGLLSFVGYVVAAVGLIIIGSVGVAIANLGSG